MQIQFRGLILTSLLAVATAHCGGSATPSSNTPETSSTDPADPAGAMSSPGSTSGAAAGTGETASGSGASTGSTMQGSMQSEQTGDSSALGSGAGSSTGAASTGEPLNDAQIALITESVNTAEIEQARIAQTKSKNQEVKRFAAMMIEHHGQAKTQQAAMSLGQAESALSQRLQRESKATLETLEAKKGTDFDRAYLQAQVEAHQKVLDALQSQLRPSAKNPQLRSYLQELEPTVAQHLEHAKAAQQSLQSGGQTTGSSSPGGTTGQSSSGSSATNSR